MTDTSPHRGWPFAAQPGTRSPVPGSRGPARASTPPLPRYPPGLDLAVGWAWRILLLIGAIYVLSLIMAEFALVALPLVLALLASALLVPIVHTLVRWRLRRSIAALLVLIAASSVILLLLVLAGRQVAQGSSDLSSQVVAGLEEIRIWLMTGPLQASDSQINRSIESAQASITSSSARLVQGVTQFTATVSNIVAGSFIALFATYFFLAEGERIWAWLIRILPVAARERANSSGYVAWASLTSYVRGTILVAMADAIGVLIVAAALRLPFLFAIGVLVFVGAFVPFVGALCSGLVAVMVALVDQGPVAALVMLAGIITVQQLEAHVLQPFVLGRLVAVHPLGVVLAIGAGVLTAGVAGAVIAVPLAATLNAVVVHLSKDTSRPAKVSQTDASSGVGRKLPHAPSSENLAPPQPDDTRRQRHD